MDPKKSKPNAKKKMAFPFLPLELIVEILLRLPVKSLLRFRSVSKQWNSIISDTHFAKSHFDLVTATRNTDNKLLYIPLQFIQVQYNRAGWVDIDASLRHKCANIKLPFRSKFLVNIRGSCRGFLLLEFSSDLVLWNPTTGTHKRIPFSPLTFDVLKNLDYDIFGRYAAWFGLGYDSSTDDYLVMVGLNGYKVGFKPYMEFFSVRSNSWKQVSQDFRLIQNPKETLSSDGDVNEFPYFIDCSFAPIFCNGALHWLSLSQLRPRVNVIVAFDLMSKNFFEIPLPKGRNGCSLILLGEFLGVFTRSSYPTFVIWKMKKYRVQSSWAKFHVVNGLDPAYGQMYINKSGQFVRASEVAENIMKLNIVGEYVETVEKEPKTLCKMVVFTESILSLPQ